MDTPNAKPGYRNSTNLWKLSRKGRPDLFRTSKEYATPPEAQAGATVPPDAGWEFVATIPAGHFPVMKNFHMIEEA